jgi:hypothetical protein
MLVVVAAYHYTVEIQAVEFGPLVDCSPDQQKSVPHFAVEDAAAVEVGAAAVAADGSAAAAAAVVVVADAVAAVE